jgi:hypothetical protein
MNSSCCWGDVHPVSFSFSLFFLRERKANGLVQLRQNCQCIVSRMDSCLTVDPDAELEAVVVCVCSAGRERERAGAGKNKSASDLLIKSINLKNTIKKNLGTWYRTTSIDFVNNRKCECDINCTFLFFGAWLNKAWVGRAFFYIILHVPTRTK